MTASSTTLGDLLGPGAPPAAVREIAAGQVLVYCYFRGVLIAAIGGARDAGFLAVRKKVEIRKAELMDLPELAAVEEVNLVAESPLGPSRRFVRLMDRNRALLEFELGVDGAFVFVDTATQRPTVLTRDAAQNLQFLCVGEPVVGDCGPRPWQDPSKTPARERETVLQARKAERVRHLLRCPICKQTLLDIPNGLRCAACARDYTILNGKPVLATTLNYDGSVSDRPISANTYGQQCLALIEENREGWVLDCGSGSPAVGFYNVVHLELFAYPEVDVVTDGSTLPFADNTFDAVLSEAVLEHVQDPVAYLLEVKRVLKPGGKVRLDAAFLQPYHGYPDHYYNMTRSGVALTVSRAGLEVLSIEPGPHQRPWVTLSLVLNGMVSGFARDEHREEFLKMSVGDVLALLNTNNSSKFEHLTKEAVDRLAAGFGCLARKPVEAHPAR